MINGAWRLGSEPVRQQGEAGEEDRECCAGVAGEPHLLCSFSERCWESGFLYEMFWFLNTENEF